MTNEWTKEIETLRARVAALEAAAIEVWPKWSRHECRLCSRFTTDPSADWHIEGCPMIGGTSALDAVVSAAVAARVAAIRARVEALPGWTNEGRTLVTVEPGCGFLVGRGDVLSAIDATEGGAP